ncbi:hypothetical protein B4Q13_24860 [Lacticaseibacillus rhamnosus]
MLPRDLAAVVRAVLVVVVAVAVTRAAGAVLPSQPALVLAVATTLVLPGGLTASSAQCECMLSGAIHACERYFPAFQFVVWAGKSATEAMDAAMFDTDGEA